MHDKVFIDTNVWLYSLMNDSQVKKNKAISLINNSVVVISIQILNEICINLIKKAFYSEDEIYIVIKNMFSFYQVTLINYEICLYSSFLRKKYNISFWDSFIIASAIKSNCSILYSEDFQHNQTIDGLKIKNPFI